MQSNKQVKGRQKYLSSEAHTIKLSAVGNVMSACVTARRTYVIVTNLCSGPCSLECIFLIFQVKKKKKETKQFFLKEIFITTFLNVCPPYTNTNTKDCHRNL
uniref:Uncharacterized protein n=1 Tax=Glossina palpalis gambiensis TaxID=67801 RepID=A0A1B0AY36_9MUSC